MRDDQMMRGADGDLDVVADDTGASTARSHRAGIGICQRYLLIRSGEHLHFENLETLHLLLQLRDPLFQAARLGFERLRRLLPVGGVELLQIARNVLLNLRHAPVHLGAREVLVAIVDRLELAANGDAGLREHPNRIVLADPVSQAFRKSRGLHAIRALNEASHPIPGKSRGNHIARIKCLALD
jgi:hypothetical protein